MILMTGNTISMIQFNNKQEPIKEKMGRFLIKLKNTFLSDKGDRSARRN